jgi:hypothetical protein
MSSDKNYTLGCGQVATTVYTYLYDSENSLFTQLSVFCGVSWCIDLLKIFVNLVFA